MTELIAALIAAGVAIVGAVAGYIVNTLKAKAMRAELDSIKEALANANALYYVNCPHCGTKIYLKDVALKSEEVNKE